MAENEGPQSEQSPSAEAGPTQRPGAAEEIKTRPFNLVVGRRWIGTAFGGVKGRSELPGLVDKYMDGQIELDSMVTHTMPLEDINKAFDLMHEGKSIKSVILF